MGARGNAEAVIHPDAFPAVVDQTLMEEIAEMARSLGLGDPQHCHEVEDAEFLFCQQEPEDLQAGFVGQTLKKPGFLFHNIHKTGKTKIVKPL